MDSGELLNSSCWHTSFLVDRRYWAFGYESWDTEILSFLKQPKDTEILSFSEDGHVGYWDTELFRKKTVMWDTEILSFFEKRRSWSRSKILRYWAFQRKRRSWPRSKILRYWAFQSKRRSCQILTYHNSGLSSARELFGLPTRFWKLWTGLEPFCVDLSSFGVILSGFWAFLGKAIATFRDRKLCSRSLRLPPSLFLPRLSPVPIPLALMEIH